MLVRNLAVWAGVDFSASPGDELDLPDDVAQARIAAGLCEPIVAVEKPAPKVIRNKPDAAAEPPATATEPAPEPPAA